ncbi:hypothetical protein EV178_006277 [Coemansia sp. RSA 1646]|nr:hypothetical protein EV178_006277 [Coemansia sp. RSA 1646]
MSAKQVAEFVKWLEDNGADLSQVEIRGPSDGETGGNAVYARTGIETGQRYAWIPHKLVITAAVCTDVLGADAASGLSGRLLLASFLVHQRSIETSFWKPYIDMLPDTFHTPVEFTSDELKILHGTPLEHALADQIAQSHDEYETAKQALGDKVMSYDDFAWALSVVSSRSFCKALMRGGGGGGGGGGGASKGAEDEVLLPLLDMFNHMPLRKVTWASTDSGVEFVTREELRAGAQVFNNYGPKSNEELLMRYGFCVPGNPFSYYHIRINDSRDPMAKYKRQILARAGIDDGGADQLVRKSGLPYNLLPMLRVMAMTAADVVCLERSLAADADASQVEDVLRHGLGLRIELRARYLLEHLVGIKQAQLLKHSLRKTHKNADDGDTMSENARLALIYRNELEDILATTLSNLRAAVDELALFSCDLVDETAHALPMYVLPGGRALPQLPGDAEQMPVRPPTPSFDTRSGESSQGLEPDAKRARVSAKTDATERLVKSALLTTESFAQDTAFAEAADQVDIDDDVLLLLFLVRVAGTPKSSWHAATKRLEGFRHPMLLLREQMENDDGNRSTAGLDRFAVMLDELCEIHGSLFPLLSTHFPDVFPADLFSLDRFLWAAGIVDMFVLDVPGEHGTEGVLLL